MPSSTWDAISGGMTGDGGPIIRSSPTKIVSSIVGCESTETPQQGNNKIKRISHYKYKKWHVLPVSSIPRALHRHECKVYV